MTWIVTAKTNYTFERRFIYFLFLAFSNLPAELYTYIVQRKLAKLFLIVQRS